MLGDRADLRGSHDLRDDGEPDAVVRGLEPAERLEAVSLEGGRGGPWLEDTAARGRRPGARHRSGETMDLLFRFDGARARDHRTGTSANAKPAHGDDRRGDQAGRARARLDPRATLVSIGVVIGASFESLLSRKKPPSAISGRGASARV